VNEATQDRLSDVAEEQMLYGHYERSLDSKNRLNLPFRFREKDLVREDEPPRLMINQDQNGVVSLMTCRQYAENLARVKARHKGEVQRRFLRWLAKHSQEVPLDSQGRVAVPPTYLEAIGATKRLLILGVGTRMELWNPERYDAEQDAAGSPPADCFEAFYD
jgi:MraZ protein